MARRKPPKTLAEEVADFDDPAPRDHDPEQPDGGDSSEGSSEEDVAQATGHYLEVGKGKLRKQDTLTLGPEYGGSHISRDQFYDTGDASDDDPFASAQSRQDGSSDASDKGEDAELDDDGFGMDKDVGHGESFGGSDGEDIQGYPFRRSTGARERMHEDPTVNGHNDIEQVDEYSSSLKGSETRTTNAAKIVGGTNGYRNGMAEVDLISEDGSDEDADVKMEDKGSPSSIDEESGSEASDLDTDESSTPPPADDDRAALRKIMADSQKLITSNLSEAVRSDVAKGRAIKHQRTAFDSLLNTRIRLQKALVATNSLRFSDAASSNFTEPAVEAAEKAALRLWSTIDSLRQSLQPQISHRPVPPTPIEANSTTTPISSLWTHMQASERYMRPNRLSTLNKWASKTAPTSSLPRTDKFSSTPAQQPLSTVLEQQLSSTTNMEKLIAKTQIPRSCAPLQAAAAAASSKQSHTPSPDSEAELIYDDADFYSLLLRDLLEQRSSDPHSITTSIPGAAPNAIPGIKDPALRIHKKRVDTKASKGRKIRYNVQEKLINFMPPDDRGEWGVRQRDELFKGLLGTKVMRVDDELMDMDESGDETRAEEGLRLFR
ncbi:MAG: hypothetical protein Q9182_005429 [Xanthomendoza sp. 2 TL-2023]